MYNPSFYNKALTIYQQKHPNNYNNTDRGDETTTTTVVLFTSTNAHKLTVTTINRQLRWTYTIL